MFCQELAAQLARDVLPKSLEFIDTDHMVAEVNDIYLRTPSAVAP